MNKRNRKLTWIKFYPSDWQAEPTLKGCSLASKGLWLEMLGLMAHSVKHGHLCQFNAPEPLTSKDLALTVGAEVEEVEKCLEELGAKGVFSVSPKGTIYSRRLLKDAKRRNQQAKAQREKRERDHLSKSASDTSKNVISMSSKRLEPRDQRPITRDERLLRLEAKESPSLTAMKALPEASSINTQATMHSLVSRLAAMKSSSNLDRPSLEQFTITGMGFGLSREDCQKEFVKLARKEWADSKGNPIKDLPTYLSRISANKRRGL